MVSQVLVSKIFPRLETEMSRLCVLCAHQRKRKYPRRSSSTCFFSVLFLLGKMVVRRYFVILLGLRLYLLEGYDTDVYNILVDSADKL